MIMTLDVGNSQIYGGVFADNEIKLQFRNTSRGHISSDEMGLFLRGVLRENGIEHKRIKQIGICSVVPDAIHSVRGGCQKYFSQTPFILQPGVKTGLKIRYRNPIEVGADRIANSIAASLMFPGKNLIIVDLGTATTFDVVTSDRDYLGGIIVPGLRLSMEALETNTARLPAVEIIAATEIIGRSTVESIQSGLYFGNLFMIRELAREIKQKELKDPNALLIGTGGFSRLFERSQLFDQVIPELVLLGIKNAIELN